LPVYNNKQTGEQEKFTYGMAHWQQVGVCYVQYNTYNNKQRGKVAVVAHARK
jgi:hypothetical protein